MSAGKLTCCGDFGFVGRLSDSNLRSVTKNDKGNSKTYVSSTIVSFGVIAALIIKQIIIPCNIVLQYMTLIN